MLSDIQIMLQVLLLSSLVLSVRAHTYYDCATCQRFPSKELQLSLFDVKRILIDEQNDKVIVAARDYLIRLNPSLSNGKSSYEYVNISAPEDKIQQCIQSGNTRADCYNYIRLLVFDNNKTILACGTYAAKPRCWRFKRSGSLSISDEMDGVTRSPSFPDQNVTGVIIDHPVNNGYIFTGVNIGSGTRVSAIYRKAVDVSQDKNFLATVQSEYFLKDANFVSSYVEPDNFIYFFWREKAIESQNMEVYSRVGRVCSYDAGTKFVMRNKFTSFTKSRLLCSVPGAGVEAFAYNYLQSTFKYIESSSVMMYGIFTTPESGLVGSAVCLYSLNAIQSLFANSQYMEEVQIENPTGVMGRLWKSVLPPKNVQDPGRPMCNSSLNTLSYLRDTAKFAKKHPLLADTVQPTNGEPLLVMPNIRFTQIVVDKVQVVIKGAIQSIPVMFLATENGTIYKVVEGKFLPDKKAKIVEQINVFQASRPIQTLKVYKNSLYVGCTSAVTKISTHRCSVHTTCRSCVELKDPYCGWSNNQCTTKQTAGSSSWVQDIVFGKFESVCPVEPPSCSIKLSVNNPGGTSVLECSVQGIPVPSVTHWHINGRKITTSSYYDIQDMDYSQKLLVHNFGLKNLGEYQCSVQNTKGSTHHCKLSVQGTLPVVSSGFYKTKGQTHFWCNAKGFPKPSVVRYKVVGGLIKPVTTSINMDHGDRAYYCVAQNTFGPSVGTNFTIEERKLNAEIKMTEEVWDEELEDSDSTKYKTLSIKLQTAIVYVYYNDTAFMDTTQVTFSKGSVIADVHLRFASKPSETDANLLTALQNAISSGKIGSIQVQKTDILRKYTEVPTQGYRAQAQGIDRGLFAVAVLVAIVLSVLVGFLMGIKFHRQALASCGPKGHDSSIREDKNIQSPKYTKSPTIDNTRSNTDEKHTKLLHNKDGKNDPSDDGDRDSIGSSGGQIHIIIEPTKTPEQKVLVNGKIPKSC